MSGKKRDGFTKDRIVGAFHDFSPHPYNIELHEKFIYKDLTRSSIAKLQCWAKAKMSGATTAQVRRSCRWHYPTSNQIVITLSRREIREIRGKATLTLMLGKDYSPHTFISFSIMTWGETDSSASTTTVLASTSVWTSWTPKVVARVINLESRNA